MGRRSMDWADEPLSTDPPLPGWGWVGIRCKVIIQEWVGGEMEKKARDELGAWRRGEAMI
jgi:hypothetical protein